MAVTVDHPSWARLEMPAPSLVRAGLTYTDKSVEYEIRRRKQGEYRLRRWMGSEKYDEELADLQARRKVCLLRDDGTFPAGLTATTAANLNQDVVDAVPRPELSPLPWARKLPYALRPYQVNGVETLIRARHGALELCTGAGKTALAAEACRRVGGRAIVMSPYSTIVKQTVRFFREHLGAARVGQYGDGRHQLDRLVTVATAQALQRLKVDDPRGQLLRDVVLVIFDEAHRFAADTLQYVCQDLLGHVPYRFFLTGTHFRGDGRQLLLDGLTGPVLAQLTVKEAVANGWLARPAWRMLRLHGGLSVREREQPADANRRLLLRSPRVVATVADVVNKLVAAGRPTLVLIDEVSQFPLLLPHLRCEAKLAFGGLPSDKTARAKMEATLPELYRREDALELVDQFNDGKFPLLVGTPAVGTGVDVRAAAGGVYWLGGSSRTDLEQGAGRFLRLAPGKTDTVIYDIDVEDGGIVHRQAQARAEIYRDIYPDYKERFVGPRLAVV